MCGDGASPMKNYPHNNPQSHCKLSKGFSLVELMVSLVIGLVILLALYVVLMSNIQSLSTTEAQSALTDNGQRASQFIRQMLKNAGYRPFDTVSIGATFDIPANWVTQNQVISGTDGGLSGVVPGTDTLIVRYRGAENGTLVDCSGLAVPVDDQIIVTIDVADNQLRCTDSLTDTPYIVADGIESLQVRYSLLDTNRYIVAPDLDSSQWEQVDVVEFAVLARSSELTSSGATNSRSYDILEGALTATGDRFLRSVYEESVVVRNLVLSGRL